MKPPFPEFDPDGETDKAASQLSTDEPPALFEE